jgi:hypothetical protein
LQDLTDNEGDVDGWVVKRNNFHVKKFGNAVLYCGRTFRFHDKAEQFKTTPTGKIVDVVQRKTGIDKELYFRYYNHDLHRKPKSDMWKYEKCAVLMNTSKTNSIITLDPKNGSNNLFGYALLNRKIQKGFKLENEKGKYLLDENKKQIMSYYFGTIDSFDSEEGKYSVTFEDGDKDRFDQSTILPLLKP